jgi:hypothetical protein
VRTELRSDGDEALFVLLDLDDDERAAARDLFFAENEDGGFVKRFAADGAAACYPRFARCAQELLDQTARRRPARWEEALATLLDRAAGVDWWLGGSAALAVRGLAVAPRDLDLVTSAAGAEELARRLADLLVEPLTVSEGWIATHFARAFAGARIEWAGAVSAAADDGGVTDFGPTAAVRLETVAWRGHALRVPPLELQLEVARRRGLHDRVAEIERAR